LKILLVAKPWKGGLARYVFLTLQELYPGSSEWVSTYPGTGFDRFQYALNKNKWKQNLLRRLQRQDYDVAIFINFLKEFEALEYRDTNILWLTDGYTPQLKQLAPYGRIFLSDPGYETALVSVIGTKRYAGVMPFACYPQLHMPEHYAGPQKNLCFIGNRNDKRDGPLGDLFAAGLSPTVIGNYFLFHPLFWKYPAHFIPPIANEKMGAVYARHRLSLNIHARILREGTNMRTFECAGYGISQLVEHRPGIETYFEPQKEIGVFRSSEEMIDLCRNLLGNRPSTVKMAERARKRALAEHTYQQRVKAMLRDIV